MTPEILIVEKPSEIIRNRCGSLLGIIEDTIYGSGDVHIDQYTNYGEPRNINRISFTKSEYEAARINARRRMHDSLRDLAKSRFRNVHKMILFPKELDVNYFIGESSYKHRLYYWSVESYVPACYLRLEVEVYRTV